MPHYKNGRLAYVGDGVVFRDEYGQVPVAGIVTKVVEGDTCNLAVLTDGRGIHQCITSTNCVRIDDALAAPLPPAQAPVRFADGSLVPVAAAAAALPPSASFDGVSRNDSLPADSVSN